VRGVVPDDRLDPLGAQRLHVAGLRSVRAADRGAERARNEREPAHPGAADAHEVKAPAAPRGRGHVMTLAVKPGAKWVSVGCRIEATTEGVAHALRGPGPPLRLLGAGTSHRRADDANPP